MPSTQRFLATDAAVIQYLTSDRVHNRPAPSTYLLAAGFNMVASTLRPVLDELEAAGRIVNLGPGMPLDGVEVMPGDDRWALAEPTEAGEKWLAENESEEA